jgi:predicted dinucleotide-binding enzyme
LYLYGERSVPRRLQWEESQMDIAIIGAGKVGTTLGDRWSSVGHAVTYGVRDPSDDRHAQLGRVAAVADAAAGADVVVVAVPWSAVPDVVDDIRGSGAVLVDATNPLAANQRDLTTDAGRSGAEWIAERTGSTRVVKAFNTTGAANMADPDYPHGTPVMLLAGDDDRAKETVAGLAVALGFDACDAGPLAAAADLEHLAAIWIRLAYRLGHGPGIAFSLLRR